MTESGYDFFTVYLIVISLVTIIFTVYDKLAAKNNPRHRVPEKVLMLLGVFGGAVAEYITMQIIRHKTKHGKFMIGLPLIIVCQIAVFILIKRFI